jgi:hypothetical protein
MVYGDRGVSMNLLYNEPEILKVSKIGRFMWLGKLFGTQKLPLHKPEGTQRVGRPAIRWLGSVEEGLKTTGIRNCRQKSQERNQCRRFSLCLTNYALRHEDVWGSGCMDPHILDLGTSCRWAVSFTSRPLYPWGESPRYPLDRWWLGGPHNQPGRHGEEKNIAPTGSRTPTPRPSSL